MSTRCHVIIKWDDKETFIYHHHDGYPEGVGSELKKILESCTSYDWETIAEKILGYDDQYEEDSGIHGDEDYIYEIEAKDTYATLKCYSYNGLYRKELVFKEIYPEAMKSDLDKKIDEYKTNSEKCAFLDGVLWIENHPKETIIRRILDEALNIVPDLSNDIEAWTKEIKKRLDNGG